MNDKILEQHMMEDAKFQDEMRSWKETVATKDDIEKIVVMAIENYFKNKGRFAFTLTVGSSVLIGALVVIGGGLKTVLGWIGFTLMQK